MKIKANLFGFVDCFYSNDYEVKHIFYDDFTIQDYFSDNLYTEHPLCKV